MMTTMSGVSVQLLTPDAVDETYVLARLAYGDLTLDQWRKAVAKHEGRGDILVAREGDSASRGLLISTIHSTFAGAPTLHVERLVSFDLMEPRRTAEALLEAALRHGRRRGCDSLCLGRPLDDETAVRVFASRAAVLHQVF